MSLDTDHGIFKLLANQFVTCPAALHPVNNTITATQMYFLSAEKPAYDAFVSNNPGSALLIQDLQDPLPVTWDDQSLHFYTQSCSVANINLSMYLPVVLDESACVQYRFAYGPAGAMVTTFEFVGGVCLRKDHSNVSSASTAWWYNGIKLGDSRVLTWQYDSGWQTVTIMISHTQVSIFENGILIADEVPITSSQKSHESLGNVPFSIMTTNGQGGTMDVRLRYIRVISGVVVESDGSNL